MRNLTDQSGTTNRNQTPDKAGNHDSTNGSTNNAPTAATPAAKFSRDRLRAIRHLAQITRDQLAERAHLTAEAVERIETGDTAPTDDQVAALCAALACTPTDLAPTGDPAGEYWDALCAALPPLTDAQITAVAAVLNRTPTTPQE